MQPFKILIPYNFTPYDENALAFVARAFGHREKVHITLLHTYTPVMEVDIQSNPELAKLRDGMVFLAGEIDEKKSGLETVRQSLCQKGFYPEQIDVVFKKKIHAVAEEVIETAAQGGFQMLVLSRQPAKMSRLFTRNLYQRAITMLSGITVCVVT